MDCFKAIYQQLIQIQPQTFGETKRILKNSKELKLKHSFGRVAETTSIQVQVSYMKYLGI